MNKVELIGRLTRDPNVTYTQGEKPMAIARFTLAVDRRGRRSEENNADFISCVAFDKTAEFAEKYLHQGPIIIFSSLPIRAEYTGLSATLFPRVPARARV